MVTASGAHLYWYIERESRASTNRVRPVPTVSTRGDTRLLRLRLPEVRSRLPEARSRPPKFRSPRPEIRLRLPPARTHPLASEREVPRARAKIEKRCASTNCRYASVHDGIPRIRNQLVAPRDTIAAFAGAFTTIYDPTATSAGPFASSDIADEASAGAYETDARVCETERIRQQRPQRVRNRCAAERNSLTCEGNDFSAQRNDSSSVARGFSLHAIVGTADASPPRATGTRRGRDGSSHSPASSPVPECPAISGRNAGEKV